MTPEVGFLTALLTTVVLLALVVWTGKTARRRLHIPCVLLAAACLAAAIVYALKVGERYDLEAAGIITPIHLILARVATFSFLLPIATGIYTLRRPGLRRLHGRLAYLVVGLVLAAALTGGMMMMGAERLPVN